MTHNVQVNYEIKFRFASLEDSRRDWNFDEFIYEILNDKLGMHHLTTNFIALNIKA